MSYQQDNFKAIADAIREKDGTTDAILPIDFPDRIRAIKTGASLPSGGTTGQALVKQSNADEDVMWGDVVPAARAVNGKSLTNDITLSALDVGARPSSWTPITYGTYALSSGSSSLETGTIYVQYE